MDTLRPDKLGCYGYDVNTSPHIDKFAQDGIKYEFFYTTSTWTLPAAVSLLTGMYSNRFGILSQFETVPEYQGNLISILGANGFLTSLVTATPWVSSLFGIDWFDQEQRLFEREDIKTKRRRHEIEEESTSIVSELSDNKLVIPTSKDINKELFKILEQDGEQLILAWSMDTHGPYFLRGDQSFFGNSPDEYIPSHEFNNYKTDAEIDRLKSIYHDMIRYNDDQFGSLVKQMKQIEEYTESLIILVGDHGEAFGEHSKRSPLRKKPLLGHGGVPYEEIIRVPLLIKYPDSFEDKPESGVRKERRQITDIFPTVLDIVGIDHDDRSVDGATLLEPTDSKEIFTETRFRQRSPHSLSLTKGRWKYISVDSPDISITSLNAILRKIYHEILTDRELLFNLESDPAERHNRAKDNPEVLAELRGECRQLQSGLRNSLVDGGSVAETDIERATKDQLKELGYL